VEPLRKCRGPVAGAPCPTGAVAYTEEQLGIFGNHKNMPYGKDTICTPCSNRNTQIRIAATRYGTTVEDYDSKMATSTVCECCGDNRKLSYDHCHDSMDFRGVLCNTCNLGIGKLGDTKEGILRALRYFELVEGRKT